MAKIPPRPNQIFGETKHPQSFEHSLRVSVGRGARGHNAGRTGGWGTRRWRTWASLRGFNRKRTLERTVKRLPFTLRATVASGRCLRRKTTRPAPLPNCTWCKSKTQGTTGGGLNPHRKPERMQRSASLGHPHCSSVDEPSHCYTGCVR